MIVAAVLCDLRGAKILAAHSFTKMDINSDFIQLALEMYYGETESEERVMSCLLDEQECGVCFSKIDERTMLIGILDTPEPDGTSIEAFDSLVARLMTILEDTGDRVDAESFTSLVDDTLRKQVFVCFLSSGISSVNDRTGIAVEQLMGFKRYAETMFTDPLGVGPFSVEAVLVNPSVIVSDRVVVPLRESDILVYIVSGPQANLAYLQSTLEILSPLTSTSVIVVPGSDNELELAREMENKYDLNLCDSVSTDPRRLLVSLLGIAGMTDLHGELAFERWNIDALPDIAPAESDDTTAALGHQAFYVVDKAMGMAKFAFYYEEPSIVIERAPNVVAAISTFKIDAHSSAETSVFKAGNLRFALIEREGLIFTLITGEGEHIDKLRERFSSLPDLYLEDSPDCIETSDNLYSYPPFTLKLLATIPPKDWPGKYVPTTVKEPDWERFDDRWMKEFLRSVWSTLDGKTPISKFTGDRPLMTMGALHFLKHMGAIDVILRVTPSDIPRVTGEIDTGTVALYSDLERILPLVDGTLSIENIAAQVGIDKSILVTVFTELCKRGSVDFE